jgi:hypothetical protein
MQKKHKTEKTLMCVCVCWLVKRKRLLSSIKDLEFEAKDFVGGSPIRRSTQALGSCEMLKISLLFRKVARSV